MSKVLKAAIEANDPDAVSKALKGVKDLNRKLPGARSPLLHACASGADKVLEALFGAGAIGEKRNTFPGDTPFAVAAAHRQFGVMKRLLALKQASDEAVRFVTENACMDGNVEVLGFVLEQIKPHISIKMFRLASVSSKGPALLKMLVDHGGDLNARHDTNDAKRMTPLHELVSSGKVSVIRTLVGCGADVNARDGLGRTPLMVLAASLEGIRVGNSHTELLRPLVESGAANVHGELPKTVNCLDAIRTLIEFGADASLRDNCGNDAIDHYAFECTRWNRRSDSKIVAVLREAGAQSSSQTLELFSAIKTKNPETVRAAIRNGADVNRVTPPPVPVTPLSSIAWNNPPEAVELIRVLLEAGADPNKYDSYSTPLIRAARCGNLSVVKELIAAGANVNAIEKQDEVLMNAYIAAETNQKFDVVDYLKSVGACRPKPKKTKVLRPGVGNWNDFSELLVKGTVDMVVAGVAKMIEGKARSNVYGLSVSPGKQAYVVARPKGMEWCNVFRIAPPPLRFEDAKKTETAASALAKACSASVLVIEYSDTSDAASIVRIEPTGKRTNDNGWDRESIQEMVEAMGEEAPAWAKKQLAKTSDDEPRSTERLVMLAEQEKFLVAAFGLNVDVGRKVDVEFADFGEDAFDGVAFVTN